MCTPPTGRSACAPAYRRASAMANAPGFVIFSEKQSFSFLFQFSLKIFQVENFQVRIYIPWEVPHHVSTCDTDTSSHVDLTALHRRVPR